MKRIGLIFDMDGTLWDARKEVAASWSYVSKKHGYQEITEMDLKKRWAYQWKASRTLCFLF